MKAIWNGLCLVLIVHVLAGLGFVGWLKGSGRLDKARVAKVRDVFRTSLEEEKRQQEEADRLADETRAKAEEAARLEAVSNGPVTLAQRLDADKQADEIALQRVERMQREIADLRRQLVVAKDMLAKQKSDLESERKEFEAAMKREAELRNRDDFQQAVAMYEQLKPRQAKEMFQTLLAQQKEQDVIDYLAAMQLRKAAAVLKEFKTPEETTQAAELVQKLRERGVDAPGDVPAEPAPTQAPESQT